MATREQIESLVKLVTEIASQPGNEWVGKKMQNLFGNQKSSSSDKQDLSEEIDLIYKDLKRTKFFLKYIDGSNWREGFKFYKKIKSSELKLSLAADYKEMKIAEQEQNLLEYARRIILQLETIFNYLIISEDAFSIIKQADDFTFISKKHNGEIYYNVKGEIGTDLKKGDYAFFNKEGSPKPVESIVLPSKFLWIKIYFQIDKYSFDHWNDLVFIRNKSSHSANMKPTDQERFDRLNSDFESTARNINKVFMTIFNQLIFKLI
jgi:hypothetical protein